MARLSLASAKRFSLRLLLILLSAASVQAQNAKPQNLARPTPQQRHWQDLEIGMFIHFAPNTWQDKEGDDLSTPLAEINPTKLDTDLWVDTAVKMGAKYIVFVAKHVGGFCMWQTATTDYSIKHTAWKNGKGDVVGDLAASCKKRGIKLGIYLSPRDDKHGAGLSGRCKTAAQQKIYEAIYRQQLTELLTNYGDITEIWCDGSLVFSVADILQKHAPKAMIFQGPNATIRWVGNEDGFAPYPAWNAVSLRDAKTGIATAMHGDADGEIWLPNEVDVSLRRPNWFWSTTNHKNILSLEQLLEIYYRSVGRGAQLLLNVTPNRDGLIPDADAARLKEFGEQLQKRFGKSVADYEFLRFSKGWGHTAENIAGFGFSGKDSFSITLKKPVTADHAILMEDTSYGERVRAFRLEGLSQGKWVVLGSGTAIGHKRIQAFAPIEVKAVRLVVTQASATPQIRRLALFDTNTPPPKTWQDKAELWADDVVGHWQSPTVELELSKKIQDATQYRLRFVADDGAALKIENAEVFFEGIHQPHLLGKDAKRGDVLLLTVPGLGQKMQLRCKISGAKSGAILLQKL